MDSELKDGANIIVVRRNALWKLVIMDILSLKFKQMAK